jgi:hypothetical protein
MSNNSVTISLNAKDNISIVIKNIKGQIDGLKPSLGGVGSSISQLGSSFGSVAGKVGLVTASVVGMGVAIGAAIHLADGLKKAMDMETMVITSASAYKAAFNLPLDTTIAAVKADNVKISEMGARMPGEAATYSKIFTGTAPSALVGYKGSMEEFRRDHLARTERLGVMSLMSGVSGDRANLGINRMLTQGASVPEIGLQNFFERLPGFRPNMKSILSDLGMTEKSFKSADTQTRLTVLDQLSKKYATPEVVDKLQGTGSALLGNLRDRLFDPNIGVFGFLRETSFDGSGMRSGFAAFKDLLVAVSKLATTVGAMIGLDPMKGIVQLFDWLTKTTLQIDSLLKSGGASIYMIGDGINWAIGQIANSLKAVEWDILGYKIGLELTRIVASIDWKQVNDLLWGAIKNLAEAIVGAIIGVAVGVGEWIRTAASNAVGRALGMGDVGTERQRTGTVYPFKTPDTPLPTFAPNGSSNMIDSRQSPTVQASVTINGARMSAQEIAGAIASQFNQYKQAQIA